MNYEIMEGYISGSVGDKAFTVTDTPENRAAAQEFAQRVPATVEELAALTEEVLAWSKKPVEELLEQDCPYLVVDRKTGKYYLKYNQKVSTYPMPKALTDRILDSHEKGIDFMPLIMMWVRFLRNPNLKAKGPSFGEKFFNFVNMKYVHPVLKKEAMDAGFSEEIATKRATIYQMKITKEGLLNGYKVSREIMHKFVADEDGSPKKVDRYARTFDVNTGKITGTQYPAAVEDRLFEPAVQGQSGDAFTCVGPNGFNEPGHFIRVGCVHALPSWDMVDCNDDHTCVKGLHIGGLYYVNNLTGEIHNVFVDPMHVGAVADDFKGVIRCKQYFVHSSLSGVNGSIYHSSEYAKMTDKEWEEALAEAVSKKEELMARAEARIDELKAL